MMNAVYVDASLGPAETQANSGFRLTANIRLALMWIMQVNRVPFIQMN